ncbi:MAG: MYXO-CTERM sorting domain-containing protein [Myxococcota bacterium]
MHCGLDFRLRTFAWGAGLVVTLATADASAATWGSFDSTRINYDEGCLSCPANATFASLITANGDTIAADTTQLTAVYLGGIDVFYTSMLSGKSGSLNAAEQTALQAWIAEGGTLIVSVEAIPEQMVGPAYDTFTSDYGVTAFMPTNGSGSGSPLVAHPIVAGVTTYEWNLGAHFTVGADALVLGEGAAGQPFLAVLEPSSDFCEGGRIAVVGDHNIFNDGLIESVDNTTLASNLIAWAATPEPPCDAMGSSGGSSSDSGGSSSDSAGTTAGVSGTSGDDTTGGAGTGAASTGGPGLDSTGAAAGDDTTDSGSPPMDGDSSSGAADGTGGGDGSASDGGGCRVGGDPVAWWALALLGLFVRRRRPCR